MMLRRHQIQQKFFWTRNDLLSLRGLFSQILSRTNQLVPLEERMRERE